MLKISKDTAFLHRIDKLEKYLGLRLKKNPLIYLYNVDGTPANLPGVPVKRRSKKVRSCEGEAKTTKSKAISCLQLLLVACS